jgi:hypothetical protein
MTRPFSVAFTQTMVRQLTGKDAVSSAQLSRQTGVRQQNLSRWLEDARSLPVVAANNDPLDMLTELRGDNMTLASRLRAVHNVVAEVRDIAEILIQSGYNTVAQASQLLETEFKA